jgi:hypothetical protein
MLGLAKKISSLLSTGRTIRKTVMPTVISSPCKHLPVLPVEREFAEHDNILNAQTQRAFLEGSITTAAILARYTYHRAEANWESVQPDCTESFNSIYQRKCRAIDESWRAHSVSPKWGKAPPDAGDMRFAIETAQLAAKFNDEGFLAYAQELVFGLGIGWRKRAFLADYLHPYPVTPQNPQPSQRLTDILAKDDPALYVRQTILEKTATRHKVRPQRANGKSVLRLSALDTLALAESRSFSLRWQIRVNWDEVAECLDNRTARELDQVLRSVRGGDGQDQL